MRMYDIIDKKRNLGELTSQELAFFLNGYNSGEIPDYQASALLMAICFAGMTNNEVASLTRLMAESGETLDLSAFGDTTVDKHSTGGVGDKTTLIVAPIVASLGCTVAKLSGRGLGHTGGTIDKLESIKGFNTNIQSKEFLSITQNCGICVSSAGTNLVPADKKLYALRDVTATVSSIPLIVSSIMSKKLAGGAKSIVLDVKIGNGAFMKTYNDAKELAQGMVTIGKLSGRKVAAVITDMSKPLGRNIGNSLEVLEAVNLLKGINPEPNLLEVCITISSQMVSLSKNISFEEARSMVEKTLGNGKAYNKFLEWISLQGGDISVFDCGSNFGTASNNTLVLAPQSGYISAVNAQKIGISAMMLGAGRATKEDKIDMSAGITLFANLGDYVKEGEPIAKLQSTEISNHSPAKEHFLNSISVSQTPPNPTPLIYEIVR